MNIPIKKIENDISHLGDHTRSLIAATANATEENVKVARAMLIEALDSGKSIATRLQDRAAAGTRACDLAVHQNPYQAMAMPIA